MANWIDRAGRFRGRIVEYNIDETRNGAIQLSIRAMLDEAWNGQEWEDWRSYAMEAVGYLTIIKKDGSANEHQCDALARHAGFSGRIEDLFGGTWVPQPCQLTTEEETRDNQTRYRIAWINGWDDAGKKQLDPGKARELAAKYGGKVMAATADARASAPQLPSSPPPAQSAADGPIPF